jgi:YVTN family beta-propeller protein
VHARHGRRRLAHARALAGPAARLHRERRLGLGERDRSACRKTPEDRADGGELWVGNRAEDTLAVLDASTLDERARIPCAKMPIRLAFTPDGSRVLATCAASDEVRVFDARSRKELRTIAIPGGSGPSTPVGLLVEPGGGYAFVACTAARKIAVIDFSNWTVTGNIETGGGPDGMAWAAGIGTIRR